MSEDTTGSPPEERTANPRLSLLLAMAMFVLVVDTSLMNVSISAVVEDLDTTVEQRSGGDRVGGARVCGVHPDQQQSRRPDRPQEGLRPRAARLRDRGPGDDAGAERDRDHHLLGDHRRARGVAAAARDAVPDPRELRGRCSDKDVCAGRGRRRDRCRGGATARRLPDDLPLLACRLRARGRRDRRRAVPDQARPRRAVHGAAAGRRGRRGPLCGRDGRPRARHSRLAGRRRATSDC